MEGWNVTPTHAIKYMFVTINYNQKTVESQFSRHLGIHGGPVKWNAWISESHWKYVYYENKWRSVMVYLNTFLVLLIKFQSPNIW